MTNAQPIAIVAQSCIFPGSLSPQSLWKNLLEGSDLLTTPDPERWRVDPAHAMDKEHWNNPAGYVQGFDDIFDPDALHLDRQLLDQLDPLFHWVLHTAHTAYHKTQRRDKGRLSILLGNLSLPSEGLAAWTESVWQNSEKPHRFNRFMSGLPAHLIPLALDRKADAFSLDAACASSLYAIKLGCEKLRQNSADLILAGAVNRADPLFLHVGFQALQALSPTGQSRPFHRHANGLVPAEGAAFIALKRLDDAIHCDDQILGVIHDAGLSNDGRSEGLLVPASKGQSRSIENAYTHASVDPGDISYIECHATGTPVGDGREIESLQQIFAPHLDAQTDKKIPIGSHKSNMGHAITAAGMAGLLKILGAFEHEVLPPTIHCDDPIDTLEDSPFRVLTQQEPWTTPRRIAAVSAFGFGGNNSHLIVEEWRGKRTLFPALAEPRATEKPPVAVVGLGIISGIANSTQQLQQTLLADSKTTTSQPLQEIHIPLKGLRFPPKDLSETLPQQLAILRASTDALAPLNIDHLDRPNTGVFIGMQTDPDIVRHGLRSRQITPNRNAIAAPLTSAAVLGALPNIVANRLNSHFDLGGYSFTTSAEEHSGDVALLEAIDAIQRGDLQSALVGAVEMATDSAQSEARDTDHTKNLTDAAITLVLKTKSQALQDGDEILAIFTDSHSQQDQPTATIHTPEAHSATGLLRIAAAIALPEFALPRHYQPNQPSAGYRTTSHIQNTALQAQPRTTTFHRTPRPVLLEAPRIHTVEYKGKQATIVAASESEFQQKQARYQAHIDTKTSPGEGVFPFTEPLGNSTKPAQIAQVFTGAAAAYPGMGKSLMLGFPHLVEDLSSRFSTLEKATRWMCHPDPDAPPTPLDKLFASSVLSQLHNDLLTEFLSIDFNAAIGFSSGETNALFATGAWRDFDQLLEDFEESGAFTHSLGGSFDLLKTAWKKHLAPQETPLWESWRVVGDRQQLEDAIADEPLIHLILINAPDDVSIGGHAPAIHRVLTDLPDHRTSHLHYDIAVHCPEIELFTDDWLHLHTRDTHPTERRLYSHAFLDHYEPTSERVAQALLGQALNTVDFPALIEKAYEDGIRIFVEHGPRTTLGPWIRSILGDKPHHVVSLDSGSDHTLRPLANALAKLTSHHVDIDLKAYNNHLAAHFTHTAPTEDRTLQFATHTPQPTFPTMTKTTKIAKTPTLMPPAPPLPSATRNRPPKDHKNQQIQPPTIFSCTSPDSHLPPYFHHQQQAFQRFLDVVATQSDVHREFLQNTQRMWQLHQKLPTSNARGELAERSPARSEGPTPTTQNGTPKTTQTTQINTPKTTHTFTRQDLEHLASHKISDIFGPLFALQDDFPRQVRMPEPPLLLADRVTGIDAEPGVISTGTIYTETDITADAWYLLGGHIPPGIMIEAGQADLLLISWMGADFENKGERIYRLLGCELTYKKGLPQVGDTLSYDIHIDGHAKQGPVRIFFFHYDCRVDNELRLSVREGQAGFFTDEELANSNGILWTPETGNYKQDARVDPPRVDPQNIPTKLTQQAIKDFAAGSPKAAFNKGYERLQTHTRTPNIHHGKMCLAGEVQDLDITGGPWQRGYMRTEFELTPDAWFFDGHFKDDPCMPGTLMFEGGMQVMSLYMTALGFTLDRDGWRFEPVPDTPFQLRCRGQATPESRTLTYEIFVEEVIDGDQPTLVADILATVDGLKAFHCRAMKMHLVPDTPLTETLLTEGFPDRDPRAVQTSGVTHDKLAILATGNGPASICLGPRYREFDGHRRMPRLPGEPFQFMTRATRSDAEVGEAKEGTTAIIEYDIPRSAWYFDENDRPVMPYAVLLEAALQPCGWLSLNSSAILDSPTPVFYRNLDGTGTLHRELTPDCGTLKTRTTMTRQARSSGMVIQSFDVQCTVDDDPVFDMETTFGFFPQKALENQVGIPTTPEEKAWLTDENDFHQDLSTSPDPDHPDLWPAPMLRMIDRATGLWEDGESLRIRTEKDVDPAEWFFKAHFFQDPVQPGSLGVEAMIQTLRFALLHKGHHRRFESPRIEPIALSEALTWTYRGQVLPENKKVNVLLDLHKLQELPDQTIAHATSSLWVDGLKIYSAENLALRITERGRPRQH